MLALSSLSTLAAGLAWLLISGAGLAAWLTRPATQSAQIAEQYPSLSNAARWWLLACVAGFILMAIPTAYWGGPWPERHPQWRLLTGAIGLWLLLRYSHTPAPWVYALGTSSAIALLLALGLVITSGADAAPTNRIPWMAGLSLLSCALLTLSHQSEKAPIWLRRIWWAASATALCTVLISGVRGSWLLWLVWPLAWFAQHRLGNSFLPKITWRYALALASSLLLLILAGMQAVPERDRPWARVASLVEQSRVATPEAAREINNSSIAVRLGLYRAGIQQVTGNPSWLGIGYEQHKQLLRQHLQEMGAMDMLDVIGHYHSDWLNAWAEFGLLGLLGYLSFPVGMVLVVVALIKQRQYVSLIGMISVLVMHTGTGMTNVNFAHNYYPVLLSICMTLIFLRDTPPQSSARASAVAIRM